jgi:hypothetical protein
MAQNLLAQDKQTPAATRALLAPPEEQFWKRYSPHHEAPLSGAGSFAIHVLVVGFLLLWAVYLAAYFTRPARALPTDAVRLDANSGGGGPNTRAGDPASSGRGLEIVNQQPQTGPLVNPEDLNRPPLKIDEPSNRELTFQRPIAQSDNETFRALELLDKQLKTTLADERKPGSGQGGPGKDGGKGPGAGPGEGPGQAPGKGKLNARVERMLRWSMVFDTNNGKDYLDQLKGLGALLAVPVKEEKGSTPDYRIIRDLAKRPAVLLKEDIAKINRIYWIDTKPKSVQDVMTVLGVKEKPSHFVAFMPQELEDKLFRLEKAYKGLPEDQIEATKFKVLRTAKGYDVQVVEQTAK